MWCRWFGVREGFGQPWIDQVFENTFGWDWDRISWKKLTLTWSVKCCKKSRKSSASPLIVALKPNCHRPGSADVRIDSASGWSFAQRPKSRAELQLDFVFVARFVQIEVSELHVDVLVRRCTEIECAAGVIQVDCALCGALLGSVRR